MRSFRHAIAVFVFFAAALPVLAEEVGAARDLEQRLSKAEAAAASAQSAGDNAWMLASAALVLMMTGPGLALFYAGLVRKKNVLSIKMHSFAMMAVITILWAVFGYSLCFSEGTPIIGGLSFAFLNGVGASPNPDYGATIPHSTFMIYQCMFAVITPALITGAFADRVRFGPIVLFMTLWTIVVYFPMCHMVWGKGGLLNATLGGKVPTLDFAGGTVVHITAGVSALVCAVYLGKRIGYPTTPMPPHSPVLSFIGGCLLWVGWFGFNAGSALASNGLASSAFVATHLAGAAGALAWMTTERQKTGKCSSIGAVTGAVAGLATITPASGFVGPFPAIIIGAVAGVVCYLMCAVVKARFGYDDSLDVFGCHGIGGTIGTLLAGVFANSAVNPVYGAGKPVGLLEGHGAQVVNQSIAVLIAWVLAIGGSFVCLVIVDKMLGLRVSADDEHKGLDQTQHGEHAYEF
ncbi:MAG: ammonium transporter Amt [Planctomycetota bacterium]|nr:MAG: ammonium transporter Amt [Planctomycetota bacterium]